MTDIENMEHYKEDLEHFAQAVAERGVLKQKKKNLELKKAQLVDELKNLESEDTSALKIAPSNIDTATIETLREYARSCAAAEKKLEREKLLKQELSTVGHEIRNIDATICKMSLKINSHSERLAYRVKEDTVIDFGNGMAGVVFRDKFHDPYLKVLKLERLDSIPRKLDPLVEAAVSLFKD